MTIRIRETTRGFISVWSDKGFCGYVSKRGVVREAGDKSRAYAIHGGSRIVGDFSSVRSAIRAVAASAA